MPSEVTNGVSVSNIHSKTSGPHQLSKFKKGRPVFLFKLVFEIRFSDALLATEVIKINRDKNGRFTFGIFEKPETKVLSHYNDSRIDASQKEEKSKDSRTRKVCINSHNKNLVIKTETKRKTK